MSRSTSKPPSPPTAGPSCRKIPTPAGTDNALWLDLIANLTPGELELIDFDSVRDLGGPFEVPFIDQLLGLVGAGGILSIELAFPTVQTEGKAEDFSLDYFQEGGLIGVDFSEISGTLFNILSAKIDYSPEMKELAGIQGSLTEQAFDQLVDDALNAFSATIFDLLDGKNEAVPVFLIDTTDQTGTSLLHINTFPDDTSTIGADTASFGFYASYGESAPVINVSIDVDQAVAFVVNKIVEAIAAAVSAGTTTGVTEVIPTINPLNISFGIDEVLELLGIGQGSGGGGTGGTGGGEAVDITDFIDFGFAFEAADLDVSAGADFTQEFTLSIDDMSYLVTLEDGTKQTFSANGTGKLVIADASAHDDNGDGLVGYTLDIVPTAMFSNDTEIGLNLGYVFDLLKAEFSAGLKLPLADLLNIAGLPDIEIPGIDIGLGPLLRLQGDLDLLDVDVFESRFQIDVGSDSHAGAVDVELIGVAT